MKVILVYERPCYGSIEIMLRDTTLDRFRPAATIIFTDEKGTPSAYTLKKVEQV